MNRDGCDARNAEHGASIRPKFDSSRSSRPSRSISFPLASVMWVPELFTRGWKPRRFPVRMPSAPVMKAKRKWTKPRLREVPIFFECTCYVGAV